MQIEIDISDHLATGDADALRAALSGGWRIRLSQGPLLTLTRPVLVAGERATAMIELHSKRVGQMQRDYWEPTILLSDDERLGDEVKTFVEVLAEIDRLIDALKARRVA